MTPTLILILPSDWPQARRIVEESYAAFSPKAGDIIREFFDKNWIDAGPRDGTRGGDRIGNATLSLSRRC